MAIFSTTTVGVSPVTENLLHGGSFSGDVKQPQIGKLVVTPTEYSGLLTKEVKTVLPVTYHQGYIAVANTVTTKKVTVTPSDRIINFGFISEDTLALLDITNNGVVDLEISGVLYLTTAGILVTGAEVGTIIPPGETLTISILAYSTIGAEIINSLFSIVFTNDTIISTKLLIVRASSFVYSLEPELQSYSEAIIFKTEVITHTNGGESRRSLIQDPVRAIQYKTLAYETSLINYGNNMLHFGYYNRMYQPLWLQHSKITVPLSGTKIYVDTYGKDYNVGGYCVIQNDPLYPALSKISGIAGNYVEIDTAINMGAPYFIAPAVRCLQPKSVGYSSKSIRFGEFSFKLEEI